MRGGLPVGRRNWRSAISDCSELLERVAAGLDFIDHGAPFQSRSLRADPVPSLRERNSPMLRYCLIACAVLTGLGVTFERSSRQARADGGFLWRYARQMTPRSHHYGVNGEPIGRRADCVEYTPYGRGGYHYGHNSYVYRWEGQGAAYYAAMNGGITGKSRRADTYDTTPVKAPTRTVYDPETITPLPPTPEDIGPTPGLKD